MALSFILFLLSTGVGWGNVLFDFNAHWRRTMTGAYFWILLVGHTALLLYVLYALLKTFRFYFTKGNIITPHTLICVIFLVALTAWIAFWWWKKVELIPRELNGGQQVSSTVDDSFIRHGGKS